MNLKPTTIITTVRHGKKHTDGTLLREGKVQSAYRALNIDHLDGDVILFHSGEARVRDTIQVIGGNLHKQTPEELENILEEEHDLQDYVVPTLHFLKDKAVKSEYFSTWQEETNEVLLNNFLTGAKPDTAGYDSLTMAKNLARVIHTEIQFSLLTSHESKSNFINGTHEPVIMSFLFYALQNFEVKQAPKDFLESIGGSIRYTEGFDIIVYQNEDCTADVKLLFRDKLLTLDINALSVFPG